MLRFRSDTVDPADMNIKLGAGDPKGSGGCCGGYRNLYFLVNSIAVGLHILNVVVLSVLYGVALYDIDSRYVFVSPMANLHWTRHALVYADAKDSKCTEVAKSPHFVLTSPALDALNTQYGVFPRREAFNDFMPFFDFGGTTIMRYDVDGFMMNLDFMMIFFCALSAVFQSVHGWVLSAYPDIPRFMHYLEYAISSPLMVMVMAVNVGLNELFVVTSLGALFCGMNILGMCTEVFIHYAGCIDAKARTLYVAMGFISHVFGWVLFLFAMVPIWLQFDNVLTCSEHRGMPAYAIAAIVVESVLFGCFGVLQVVGLVERVFMSRSAVYLKRDDDDSGGKTVPAELLFKYDIAHAVLSVVAKTLLAYLLVAPAMSVDKSKM